MTAVDNKSVQQAIQAALKQDWPQAISANLKILKDFPHDIPSLNRLGKAYAELGQTILARKTFRKVLELDKYNSVAQNSLERLGSNHTSTDMPQAQLANFSFIEEPGKTKTVALYKLAPHNILSSLKTSQLVDLKISRRKISVHVAGQKTFVGYLPDDLSRSLIHLIALGNKYEAAIKTVTKTKVEIFIRETKRSARLRGLPSFPPKDTSSYYQFLPTEPIAESPLEIPSEDVEEGI